MIDHYYAVIMAGGGGTRLWPLSRRQNPKQMLRLFGDRTMFQIAVDRLEDLFTDDQIFVVTIADQADELNRQCPDIPRSNFLIEPMPRGTASVVAMAAAALYKKDPNSVMAVLTADHYIENIQAFQGLLKDAYEIAQKGYLVTLGITPTFASTGYGYIQRGDRLAEHQHKQAYQVSAFKEKPNTETAEQFLADGNFSWNSGMFIWKTKLILEEFEKYMPELHQKIHAIWDDLNVDHSNDSFIKTWDSIKPETIDYGIMERSQRTAVLLAEDLGWNDVGSWDSIFEVLPGDENGNILLNARAITHDTRGSLICSDQSDQLIVSLGMKNVIIVVTKDAVLVCPRGDSQRIKELVNFLKNNHYTPFL